MKVRNCDCGGVDDCGEDRATHVRQRPNGAAYKRLIQAVLLLTITDTKTARERKTAYETEFEEMKSRPCLPCDLRYHANLCNGQIDSSPVAGTILKSARRQTGADSSRKQVQPKTKHPTWVYFELCASSAKEKLHLLLLTICQYLLYGWRFPKVSLTGRDRSQ